jgi:hypothetical protein
MSKRKVNIREIPLNSRKITDHPARFLKYVPSLKKRGLQCKISVFIIPLNMSTTLD